MTLRRKNWAVLAISCLGVASSAQAALEVSLHEVNTSIGLKATNATNSWKLETDPSIPAISIGNDTTDASYIPIAGELNNTYDPTQFSLAVSPNANPLITQANPLTPNYQLGYSVEAIDPFSVTGFQVFDTNGGYYQVSISPSDPDDESVTPVNSPNGIQAGIVDDITFVLNPSEKNEALPATQDQNFFELNLVALNNNPIIVPQDYTSSGGPGSYLEIGNPGGNNITLTNGQTGPDGQTVVFNGAMIPEPATLSLAMLGMVGLAARRRRR